MSLEARITALAQAVGADIKSLQASGGGLTWEHLVTNWSTAPAQAGTVAAGAVYAYTLGGVTRYRLVPTAYSAGQDAFYANFTGGVLSGLIVSRG